MDEADMASQDAEAFEKALAARFSGAPYEVPAGKAGDCTACGEQHPRLIGDRCPRCRDAGRY